MVNMEKNKDKNYLENIFYLLFLSTFLIIFLPFLILLIKGVFLDLNQFFKTFFDIVVWKSLLLTFFAGFVALILCFIFGIPSAYILARKNFYGKNFIETILNVPVMIPHIIIGITILILFSSGLSFLVNSFFGAVFTLFFLSIPIFLTSVTDGFKKVDPKLEMAAKTLGASDTKTFFSITLPLSLREIISASLITWSKAISEFGAILIVAYYINGIMFTPVLIYERFLSGGFTNSLPLACLMLIIGFIIVLLSKNLKNKK